MPSTIIGYARTSTIDQTYGLAAQLRDLEEAGCEKVFQEQVSSVDRNRPELERALEYARDGDVFVVTKLDRLARSMPDLVRIRDTLQAKGVTLKILALGIDTSTPTGNLMMNLLGSTLLIGLSDFCREHPRPLVKLRHPKAGQVTDKEAQKRTGESGRKCRLGR